MEKRNIGFSRCKNIQQKTCDFCSNIKDENVIGLHLMGYGTNYITYNQEDKKYRLYYVCEDINYSGATLNISYCPVCGRILSNEI